MATVHHGYVTDVKLDSTVVYLDRIPLFNMGTTYLGRIQLYQHDQMSACVPILFTDLIV